MNPISGRYEVKKKRLLLARLGSGLSIIPDGFLWIVSGACPRYSWLTIHHDSTPTCPRLNA